MDEIASYLIIGKFMLKSDLTQFELDVLEWLLSGNDVVLDALRKQLASVISVSRNIAGCGFYITFVVPTNTNKLHKSFSVKPDFCFGDVGATIDSLKYGAGFLLWVKDGLLVSLEGYAYEEKWPIVIDSFQLSYYSGVTRDLEKLRKNWMLPHPLQ
jgi:hypothetical protein